MPKRWLKEVTRLLSTTYGHASDLALTLPSSNTVRFYIIAAKHHTKE